jgi:hypothetical protein
LIRFVDPTVVPGAIFEYRVQIKVANPNFGKDKLVGRPDHAKVEELVGPWVDVTFMRDGQRTTFLSIPNEMEIYASPADTKGYLEKDQLRLQIQTWLESIRPQKENADYREPIGDWVVSDIEAYRGQFIKGTKPVKLPLWSPPQNAYQFKELGKTKLPANLKGTSAIDFDSGVLLVDYEGGKIGQPLPVYRGRTLPPDDSGLEILMLTPDGRLVSRVNSADDKNSLRKGRDDTWLKWLKDTEEAGDKPDPKGPNPFGPKN